MYLGILVWIDEVVGAYQRTVGNLLSGLELLFTQQGTTDGVDVAIVIRPRGYLYEIERNLAELELAAPLFNQQLHAL